MRSAEKIYSDPEDLMDAVEQVAANEKGEAFQSWVDEVEARGDDEALEVFQRNIDQGYDTVAKLRQRILGVAAEAAQDLKEQIQKEKPLTGLLSMDNVAELVAAQPPLKAIEMLRQLNSGNQVKALRKAGVKRVEQLDVNNEYQMNRLLDAVATVLTQIQPNSGGGPREISTPSGGKNR